jgi:HEAT repeat protein
VLNTPDSSNSDREAALREINEAGHELLPSLERLVLEKKMTLPAAVYTDVLAKRYPVFATVEQMRSSDLAQRRRASESLVPLEARQPLPRLAVIRLATAISGEDDQHVWRNVMAALAHDPSPETVQLAYLAVVHPAPEVRRRACLCLAAHPDPRHAKVLLPLLEDPQRDVVVAAVQALGSLGRIDDTEPLRRILLRGSESIRADAAIALARLGDPQGRDALARLAYHADPSLRRQAAVAMGEVGDPASIATLVYLLDDRPAVRLAAIESLKKIVGRDVGGGSGPQTPSANEQVNRWKQWFAAQHASDPSRQAATPTSPRK